MKVSLVQLGVYYQQKIVRQLPFAPLHHENFSFKRFLYQPYVYTDNSSFFDT